VDGVQERSLSCRLLVPSSPQRRRHPLREEEEDEDDRGTMHDQQTTAAGSTAPLIDGSGGKGADCPPRQGNAPR